MFEASLVLYDVRGQKVFSDKLNIVLLRKHPMKCIL